MKNYSEFDRIFHFLRNDHFVEQKKKRPEVFRNDPGSVEKIFSMRDLEFLLGQTSLSANDITVSRSGSVVLSKDLQSPGSAQLDRKILRRYMSQGFSVRVNQAQRFVPALRKLQRYLCQRTHRKISMNLYYTPGAKPCFLTHQDSYPVYVIQLHGEKTWNLFQETAGSPLTTEELRDRQHACTREKLAPGDILYLPELTAHDASCDERGSLHLTIGFLGVTYEELLKAIIDDPKSRMFLKRPLPYNDSSVDLDEVEKNLELLTTHYFSRGFISRLTDELPFRDFLRTIDGNQQFFLEEISGSFPEGRFGFDQERVWEAVSFAGELRIFTSLGDYVLRVPKAYEDQFLKGEIDFGGPERSEQLTPETRQVIHRMIRDGILLPR